MEPERKSSNVKRWAFRRVDLWVNKSRKINYFLIPADSLLAASEIAHQYYPQNQIFAVSKAEYLKNRKAGYRHRPRLALELEMSTIQG